MIQQPFRESFRGSLPCEHSSISFIWRAECAFENQLAHFHAWEQSNSNGTVVENLELNLSSESAVNGWSRDMNADAAPRK